jgi:hypothetical protein
MQEELRIKSFRSDLDDKAIKLTEFCLQNHQDRRLFCEKILVLKQAIVKHIVDCTGCEIEFIYYASIDEVH